MVASPGRRARNGHRHSLHDGESPWWLDLRSPDDSLSAVVLRTPSRRIGPDQLATNAAALAVAENYGLPAPLLLGTDFDGRNAGVPVCSSAVLDRSPFHRQRGDVPLDEGVEAGDISWDGFDCLQVAFGEHLGVKEVVEALRGLSAGEERGENGDPPGAALGSDVADRNRRVDGRGQEPLGDAPGLEEPTVREHPV